ncbi:oligosaccharide flippase family protein [Allochromatium tepidum]|uniref:Polysaccharide biosynthesis protein n=1 Tax=Allochromatium tepidum TaxID=553982 RepID=A0ABM7QJH5_9GAMM|nr:oligosaccharide flippase family protein [Allochromatium tepidum]BCU05878.1 hypothetical protein Atep_05550 [Allochromatium tepidum]
MIPASWRNYRPGRLARHTAILSAGLGLRSGAQALVFLITAQLLGSQGYGAFSATLALAGACGVFVGLGGHVLLMRDVARDGSCYRKSLGAALVVYAISLVPVGVAYFLAAGWLLDEIPWSVIALVGLSELALFPLVQTFASAYQGVERIGRAARLLLVPVVARLIAAILLITLAYLATAPTDLLPSWAMLYLLATLLAVLYASQRLYRDLGPPAAPGHEAVRAYLREGSPFAIWGSAHKLYLDADKFLLAALATLHSAGVYSAGHRLVDLVTLPMQALLGAAAPRHFRAGAQGLAEALKAVRAIALPIAGYALAAGMGLTLAAPLVPRLLGAEYEEAVAVVQWLAWLPMVGAGRLLSQRILIACSMQVFVMLAAVVGAVVNIVLTVWWIPIWGWKGAAVATYGADFLTTLFMLLALVRAHRSKPPMQD